MIAGARCAAVLETRDAEIHDADAPVALVEHDVGRFDVAMNDAALMREIQGVSDPGAHLGDHARRQQLALHRVHAEIDAFDVFHRQVHEPVVLTGFTDFDDIGVRERTRRIGLAQQSELGFRQQVLGPVI